MNISGQHISYIYLFNLNVQEEKIKDIHTILISIGSFQNNSKIFFKLERKIIQALKCFVINSDIQKTAVSSYNINRKSINYYKMVFFLNFHCEERIT